jgi:hypothetical protein
MKRGGERDKEMKRPLGLSDKEMKRPRGLFPDLQKFLPLSHHSFVIYDSK